MGAERITFTLPFTIFGIETFYTVNGVAFFLNDRFLIVEESRLAVLIDFQHKIAYSCTLYHSFKLDGNEVRILSHGTPNISRCKVENITSYFQLGFVDDFDGRFPGAMLCSSGQE